MQPLALGVDLGTSGVRIAVIDPDATLLHCSALLYPSGLRHADDWRACTKQLIRAVPAELRDKIHAMAVDGTSGTLLACRTTGHPLGPALTYSESCIEQAERLQTLASDGGPAASSSGSLARALRLLDQHHDPDGGLVLLRHQADWLTGWLLQDWSFGEEGNNLRLGWQLEESRWPKGFIGQPWTTALPEIRASGHLLGHLHPNVATSLGLMPTVRIVAGTTDANAAVLAANPAQGDGITVLGTTLVLKQFTDAPLRGPGITNHRVAGRWLCGGASNTGGGVLQQEFPGLDLDELSRQIDPEQSSGLHYRPLPNVGERFPYDDPALKPILEPRPVSDALHLHGLLEGMARIEAEGWRLLTRLGAQPPRRVVTIGGGARNPQWRRLRERVLGRPVVSCQAPPAAGVARLAAQHFQS